MKRFTDHLTKPVERFIGTDIKYLMAGSFWLNLGTFAGMGVAFTLSVAYARFLPQELYGNYRYVLSIFSMVGLLALPGVGSAMVRAVARGNTGTYKIGLKYSFIGSITITFVSLFMGIIYLNSGNNLLGFAFLTSAVVVPFAEGLSRWRGYMDGMKQFRRKTLLNVLQRLFYGSLMLGAIFLIMKFQLNATLSLSLLLIFYFLGNAIPNLILAYRTWQEIPPNAVSDKNILRLGSHLTISQIPHTIASYIDSILLFFYLGPSALAAYSFAIAPPEQLKRLLANVAVVGYSKLSKQTKDVSVTKEIRKSLPKKVFKTTIISFLVVISYIIFAHPFYNIFFPNYTESIIYSQLFALSLILFPFGIFHTAIDAEGDIKKIYLDRSISPIIQILFLIILIPTFGLIGAIIGRIAGRLLNHLLAFALFSYGS